MYEVYKEKDEMLGKEAKIAVMPSRQKFRELFVSLARNGI